MGNHVVLGHTMNCCQDGAMLCGCPDAIRFEHTAKAVMNLHSIESWNAKSLVKEHLRRQGELAKKTPLQNISVVDGLSYISERLMNGVVGKGLDFITCQHGVHMTREQFVLICTDMMQDIKDYRGNRIRSTPKDREEFYDIFDSMDIDRSGVLSTGEWAGGCSVFFRGNMKQSVEAVFKVLDENGDGHLTMAELREYLKPFLKAMMPEGASALQPMLLKRATDTIFREMDKDHGGWISAEEMCKWTAEGNNIIDSLADLIDREVYALWMQNSKESMRRNYNSLGGGQPYMAPKGARETLDRAEQRPAPGGPGQYGGLPQDPAGGSPGLLGPQRGTANEGWGNGPQKSWGSPGGGSQAQQPWGGSPGGGSYHGAGSPGAGGQGASSPGAPPAPQPGSGYAQGEFHLSNVPNSGSYAQDTHPASRQCARAEGSPGGDYGGYGARSGGSQGGGQGSSFGFGSSPQGAGAGLPPLRQGSYQGTSYEQGGFSGGGASPSAAPLDEHWQAVPPPPPPPRKRQPDGGASACGSAGGSFAGSAGDYYSGARGAPGGAGGGGGGGGYGGGRGAYAARRPGP